MIHWLDNEKKIDETSYYFSLKSSSVRKVQRLTAFYFKQTNVLLKKQDGTFVFFR